MVSHEESRAGPAAPDGVVAVVLTYRRPRLATDVVRGLIEVEGFPARSVIVVVNGEGGLDDEQLAGRVTMVELPRNLGPAGGFRAGMQAALARGARWVYLCEDDVGLFDLPGPRVAGLLRRLDALDEGTPVGGVVAYGRLLDRRSGRTVPYVPTARLPGGFPEVDVAAWGASLVRTEVIESGILPHADLFFGYEDFDFWLAMQEAGWRLVVDGDVAAQVARKVFFEARGEAIREARPVDAEEAWRMYYEARNFMFLRQRHGGPSWTLWHLVRTARRVQVASSWAHRRAAIHGLWDGLRGRLGAHPRYCRDAAELTPRSTST